MKNFLFWGFVGVLVIVAGWFLVREGYITIPFTDAPQPSLSHEVTFSADVSEERTEHLRGGIKINQEALGKDQNNSDAWLDLAIQYKEAGDFKEARKVWEYMNDAFPNQDTSTFNLGVLFHQDLKKYARSEKSYREAMQRNPNNPLNYFGLHELYRYAYTQDTTAAVDILLEGMEMFPEEPNFPITLAAYYRDDKKDYESSIQYIAIARDLVEKIGDTQKVEALDGEIARLQALL